MSEQKQKSTSLCRVYKRESKSPWHDQSTVLWFADVLNDNNSQLNLGYKHYIYCHRCAYGKVLGISISNDMLTANPEFKNRYLEGLEMYRFLLVHLNEVIGFCELFSEEFCDLYMMPPKAFFKKAKKHWLLLIKDEK
ncbi:MAG: hypothetical protein WA981_03470 [Glaciecola sp.]